MAPPLFIFAATMCQFVKDLRFLELVLNFKRLHRHSNLTKSIFLNRTSYIPASTSTQKRNRILRVQRSRWLNCNPNRTLYPQSPWKISLGLERTEVDWRSKHFAPSCYVPSNPTQPTPPRLLRPLNLWLCDFLVGSRSIPTVS
ncbi:hypothetical protein I7I53_03993 [Histoplasma capsulatum var. duboisii H88]|uniref:Uncharacterized protein n=1 Tax=Ajellomyces capsulatus (strain H88) TaxID=544711 RepID=A0A8A1LV27_AJEC8|nr:hypothetical protein I7I53_03993 [Histoplasma capsulatum var. duboisii H88]